MPWMTYFVILTSVNILKLALLIRVAFWFAVSCYRNLLGEQIEMKEISRCVYITYWHWMVAWPCYLTWVAALCFIKICMHQHYHIEYNNLWPKINKILPTCSVMVGGLRLASYQPSVPIDGIVTKQSGHVNPEGLELCYWYEIILVWGLGRFWCPLSLVRWCPLSLFRWCPLSLFRWLLVLLIRQLFYNLLTVRYKEHVLSWSLCKV